MSNTVVIKLLPEDCLYFELNIWDTWPADLSLYWTNKATDYWCSDTLESVDISVDKAKELVVLLNDYIKRVEDETQ